MGIDSDYGNLANKLVSCYAKGLLDGATKASRKLFPRPKSSQDQQLMQTITSLVTQKARYRIEKDLDEALDTIDLARIFLGVDKREQETPKEKGLGYEDFVVLETMAYFKNDFFKWVNSPECSKCKTDQQIKAIGVKAPRSRGVQEISRIEVYKCETCGLEIEYPRINNPASLLQTRSGRCGEWVNCFLLILQAVLGSEAQIRYMWNMEDHVWVEYYSKSLKRWVHLDPCENAFDEPSIYSENWGKKMSYVIGIGDDYIVDLSDKYNTKTENRIPKSQVVSDEQLIVQFIKQVNARLLVNYWNVHVNSLQADEQTKFLKLYDDVILIHNKEVASLATKTNSTAPSTTTAKGRQSGSSEWTKARGEGG